MSMTIIHSTQIDLHTEIDSSSDGLVF